MSKEPIKRSHLESVINSKERLETARKYDRCWCKVCSRFISWDKVKFTYEIKDDEWERIRWCKKCQTQITRSLLK